MAIRVEGGLPDLLYRVGTEIHDLTLTESADGDRITRAWAARVLDSSIRTIFGRLIHDKVDPEALNPYEFTLTVDAQDEVRYHLPRRARQIIWVKDGGDVYYASLDGVEIGNIGFMYQGSAIKFTQYTSPSGTLTARCVLSPAPLTYGQGAAGTGASALVLATSATLGETVTEDDYYTGSRFALESGNGVGDIRQVTAYAEATKTCTVDTWATAPTTNDYYANIMDLPLEMIDAVVYLAAAKLMTVDEALATRSDPRGLKIMMEQYERAYQNGRVAIERASVGHIQQMRLMHDPFGKQKE